MYCPQCGQEQSSEKTRFCSRCGFLLVGVAELMLNGGVTPGSIQTAGSQAISPRKKGIRQGLFIFLLTFLVVPIVSFVTIWLGVQPFGVAVSAVLLFVGGLLRMAYALMFESNDSNDSTLEQNASAITQQLLNKQPQVNALAPQQSIPASTYMPPPGANRRDTNHLFPTSVTDNTTKLLYKED